MRFKLTGLLIILGFSLGQAQNWVDTLFPIQTFEDIFYGAPVDFAGDTDSLFMDISIPLGDSIPPCGRPVLIMVHGGSFISGNKAAAIPKRIREDFAKRGYVAASLSYRLGLFQTHQQIHCNISNLGVQWDCLNMQDSSEWYRAYYRGVQDVRGAIRFLVNNMEDYDIDPNNIFIVGESAGGFIAMGAGFTDDQDEIMPGLTDSYPDLLPPNAIYESPCIQSFGLDTSISSLNLSRPDLGSFEGTLNLPANSTFRIRAVGNFYGAVFNNVFGATDSPIPALYTFHQPNDLLVPYNHSRIYGGYAYCATQFPFSCGYIVNRPFVFGSKGIVNLIDTMVANNIPAPDYLFEHSNNTANCALQILDPSLQGHAIDNFWLRTTNMASFFATKIDSCAVVTAIPQSPSDLSFNVYPTTIYSGRPLRVIGAFEPGDQLFIFEGMGKLVYQKTVNDSLKEINCLAPVGNGLFTITVLRDNRMVSQRVMVVGH